MQRTVYKGTAVLLCLAAAGGIATLLIAESAEAQFTLFYTADALIGFGLAAAAGISITDRFPLAWVGWICVLVTAVALGISVGLAWDLDPFQHEGLYKASRSLTIFAFALGLVCLMLGRLPPLNDRTLTTLLVCTLVMILGTATLLTIGTLAEIMSEAYYRVPAVVAVLAILGMTLVPLVRAGRQAA